MTTTALAPYSPSASLDVLTEAAQIVRQRELEEAAANYAERDLAAASSRAYAADWRHFAAWCVRHGHAPLPAAPPVVALWVADVAGRYAAATVERRRITIRKAHTAAGFADPFDDATVARIWKGVRRTHGTARTPKAAFSTGELRQAVAALPETLGGTRDRALLLLGFFSALRRSELVALDVADVAFVREGLELTIRRSKTDTEAKGATVVVPLGRYRETCPVTALRAWLRAAGIRSGPVFRKVRGARAGTSQLSAATVAQVVKAAADSLALDPARYAAHTLRRGFCTEAIRAGATEAAAMKVSRHRSTAVFRGYVEAGARWDAPAARVLDL